ncbi:hypothetical protein KZ793_16470 [Photorhabdus sp. UCH-936]|nr:hypothetical protein [Photorhabdus antumapuensis]
MESRELALPNVRAALTRIAALLQQQEGVFAALQTNNPNEMRIIVTSQEVQGINRSIFNGFIAYLLSHPRPLSEVLNPRWKDISELYVNEFSGMTFNSVLLEDLNSVSELMISALKEQFTQRDYDFLMSFKSGKPDWLLSPESQIQYLPAVKWKLHNLDLMSKGKHIQALNKLEKALTEWLD